MLELGHNLAFFVANATSHTLKYLCYIRCMLLCACMHHNQYYISSTIPIISPSIIVLCAVTALAMDD